MSRTNFENLRVYQISETLADDIENLAPQLNAYLKSIGPIRSEPAEE